VGIKKSDGLPAVYRGEPHRALSARYPAIEPGDPGLVRPGHKWDLVKEPLRAWCFYPAKWGYIYCIQVANSQIEIPDHSNISKSRFALKQMGFQTHYVVAGQKNGTFAILDANPRRLAYSAGFKPAALPLCHSSTRKFYQTFDEALAAIVTELTDAEKMAVARAVRAMK
jgi:hypothetical protein